MANDGTLRPEAPKGLILNARLLWTFATLYRRLGDERDLDLALRGHEYLEGRFRDREHGGYRWRVDPDGRPLDDSKKVYGQAFSIYALSELYRATGKTEALEAARQVFELIERHARDEGNGGYLEALSADWSPASDLRLSDKDMNEAKSMNTHLHLLEAYTGLLRAELDATVATRLGELIGLFERHILERRPGPRRNHLHHFFDERWNVRSESYTYGHDIEAAWLLSEAVELLEDERMTATVNRWAVEIARTALEEALDEDGGLAYEGRDGAVIDPKREWWCQAEAVVGFWHAYRLTGEVAFAIAAAQVWGFIERRVVDRDHGEWFWRVGEDGSVHGGEPKVSEWKGPYHNIRMCLQMMSFIDDGNELEP
jgi:mannobiose 2-epimerase